jgi:hypothetical protein
MTAKEKPLEEAPGWTDAQAIAALRAVETQGGLAAYFDDEAKLSANELEARGSKGRGERPRGGPRRALVNRGAIFWLDLEVEGRRPYAF